MPQVSEANAVGDTLLKTFEFRRPRSMQDLFEPQLFPEKHHWWELGPPASCTQPGLEPVSFSSLKGCRHSSLPYPSCKSTKINEVPHLLFQKPLIDPRK